MRRITEGGDLQGGKGSWGITGRFEYDFTVREADWYEILITGNANGVEFVVHDEKRAERLRVWNHSGGIDSRRQKVANVWLEPGSHTLTLARYYWTGFPAVEGVEVLPSGAAPEKRVHATLEAPRIFRRGECPSLRVQAGGGGIAAAVSYRVNPYGTGIIRDKGEIPFGASRAPATREIALPCDEAGRFAVRFGQAGRQFDDFHVRPVLYEVVDTRRRPPDRTRAAAHAVLQIDAGRTPPDFWGGGDTTVVVAPFGSYRESGRNGWTQWQRVSDAVRRTLPAPSWFAYRLSGLKAQQPYLIEIDYPDDAQRTFAIALRDGAPEGIPATGVDSGGVFRLSRGLQRVELLVWPRTDDPRLVFMNAHPGRGAAVASITVRPFMDSGGGYPRAGTRQFVNWYEEGTNFVRAVGVPNFSPVGMHTAIDRWLRGVAWLGANVIMPTVVVYTFAMYPSRYHLAFSQDPNDDLLRRMILASEALGIRVVPELHARADELDWLHPGPPERKPNLLVSKDGMTNYFRPDGRTRSVPPLYSPVHPTNVDWYVDMVGELAERYKDSPAFAGVSLRLMQWANPGILNFHSLDWGYDDFTIGRFVADTGVALPPEALRDEGSLAERARLRHRLLTGKFLEEWMGWRSRQVTAIVVRLRDRVRKASPGAKLYLHLFAESGPASETWWRGAGVDVGRLRAIEGVELINATYRVGRREQDPIVNAMVRSHLLDEGALNAVAGPAERARFSNTASYLEATELVVPPLSLGYPPGTRAIWASAVANPAGRSILEPFALQLAEVDAIQLGIGGNGYAFGHPLLREFVREFTALPDIRFEARKDARDPVAVWTLQRNDGLLFYAVNREPYPIRVTLRLSGKGQVRRLATGELVGMAGNPLDLTLDAFELRTFAAGRGTALQSVLVSTPQAELATLKGAVTWLESNLAPAVSAKLRADVIAPAVARAQRALQSGHVWAARREFESVRLVELYRSSGRWPPHWGGGY